MGKPNLVALRRHRRQLDRRKKRHGPRTKRPPAEWLIDFSVALDSTVSGFKGLGGLCMMRAMLAAYVLSDTFDQQWQPEAGAMVLENRTQSIRLPGQTAHDIRTGNFHSWIASPDERILLDFTLKYYNMPYWMVERDHQANEDIQLTRHDLPTSHIRQRMADMQGPLSKLNQVANEQLRRHRNGLPLLEPVRSTEG